MEPVDLSVKAKDLCSPDKSPRDVSLMYTNELIQQHSEKTALHKPYKEPEEDKPSPRISPDSSRPEKELLKVPSFLYPNHLALYPAAHLEALGNTLHRVPGAFPLPLPIPFGGKLPLGEFPFPLSNPLVSPLRPDSQLPIVSGNGPSSLSPKRKLASPTSSDIRSPKIPRSPIPSPKHSPSAENLTRAISSIPPDIDITVVPPKNALPVSSPLKGAHHLSSSTSEVATSTTVPTNLSCKTIAFPVTGENLSLNNNLETPKSLIDASAQLHKSLANHPFIGSSHHLASSLLSVDPSTHQAALETLRRKCWPTSSDLKAAWPPSVTPPQVYTDAKMSHSTSTTFVNSSVTSTRKQTDSPFLPSHGLDLTFSSGEFFWAIIRIISVVASLLFPICIIVINNSQWVKVFLFTLLRTPPGQICVKQVLDNKIYGRRV